MHSKYPGDSKCPFNSLVGGHLAFWKGHLTIPKRSQRIARMRMFSDWLQQRMVWLGMFSWSLWCVFSDRGSRGWLSKFSTALLEKRWSEDGNFSGAFAVQLRERLMYLRSPSASNGSLGRFHWCYSSEIMVIYRRSYWVEQWSNFAKNLYIPKNPDPFLEDWWSQNVIGRFGSIGHFIIPQKPTDSIAPQLLTYMTLVGCFMQ